MSRDSSHDTPVSRDDSHLPHTQEHAGDAMLWAAGLTKAAADGLRERLDMIETKQAELREKLDGGSLAPDEKANLEAAMKLLQVTGSELSGRALVLGKLARLHSDHAGALCGPDKDAGICIAPTQSIIPGDIPETIIGKSMMQAAATRTAISRKSKLPGPHNPANRNRSTGRRPL